MAEKRDMLSQDPTAGTEYHRPDDRFIPIRAGALATAMAAEAERFRSDPDVIRRVADTIEEIVEQEVSAFERAMADRYAPFNPDRDTIPQIDLDEVRTPQGYEELSDRVDYLLEKANFTPLTEDQIRQAIRDANTFGFQVRVCPERIDRLKVWVRGCRIDHRRLRKWRHPIRGQQLDVLVYRRLATVARLKDQPYVNLKLFKEIPTTDVEALLPHADVKMTLLDRLKLLGGGAGAIGTTAMKVFKLIGAIVYWSRLLWIVLLGAVMLTYRSVMGYRRARKQRDSQRTQHLYYQNLDNNAGVIHSLISMIGQEEVKEAILSYFSCWGAGDAIDSSDALAERVQSYLEERFGATVRFDVDDAIETLTRFDMWADRDRFRVVAPETAAEKLTAHWQERRSVDYHERCARATAERKKAEQTETPELRDVRPPPATLLLNPKRQSSAVQCEEITDEQAVADA